MRQSASIVLAFACVASLVSLAGCLGDAVPTGPGDMTTKDQLILPGGPGTDCKSVCQCGFGLACLSGKCTPSAIIEYCCERPMCPPAVACKLPDGADGRCPGMPPAGDMAMPPPPPPDMAMGMMGPKSCQSNNDCNGACPQGSRGCICAASPMGMICAPTCTVAADCPVIPNMQPFQCRMGVCAP